MQATPHPPSYLGHPPPGRGLGAGVFFPTILPSFLRRGLFPQEFCPLPAERAIGARAIFPPTLPRYPADFEITALSLGRGWTAIGAFTSRRGPGEGLLSATPTHRNVQIGHVGGGTFRREAFGHA